MFERVINFIIVALILFLLVTIYSKLVALKKFVLKEADPFVPTLEECKGCFSMIDQRSTKCKFCHTEHAPKGV